MDLKTSITQAVLDACSFDKPIDRPILQSILQGLYDGTIMIMDKSATQQRFSKSAAIANRVQLVAPRTVSPPPEEEKHNSTTTGFKLRDVSKCISQNKAFLEALDKTVANYKASKWGIIWFLLQSMPSYPYLKWHPDNDNLIQSITNRHDPGQLASDLYWLFNRYNLETPEKSLRFLALLKNGDKPYYIETVDEDGHKSVKKYRVKINSKTANFNKTCRYTDVAPPSSITKSSNKRKRSEDSDEECKLESGESCDSNESTNVSDESE
jgi:hypothetical protein